MTFFKNSLHNFKYNEYVFKKLLNDENEYALLDEENTILLGNDKAENIISVVSNPFCSPCSIAHKALSDWLVYRDDIKIQIIFSTDDDKNSPRLEVAKHFMSLKENKNENYLISALDDWYKQEKKDYSMWSKQYPLEVDLCSNKIDLQKEWCTRVNITHTPCFFINGRKLPKNYNVDDIRYLV